MTKEQTEVVLVDQGIFEPVMSIEAAIAGFKKVHEVSEKLLTPNDYAMIKVRRKQPDGNWKTEEHPFRKKSGWHKLSCFWGASSETTKIQRIDHPDGSFAYRVTVRVYRKLPNGLEYGKEASALVSSLEKEGTENMKNSPRKEHDVMSAAETRAFGRAMSAYLGLGELAAEEVEGGIVEEDDHHHTENIGKKDYCSCKVPKPNPTSKNHCIECKKEIHP